MTDKTKQKQKILFNYQRNPNYRNYHVDGIYGGLTAKGLLQMDFFVEKNPVPNQEIYSVGKTDLERDSTAPATSREVVREIEGGLIMDYNMMKAMNIWLKSKIEDFESNFVAPKQPTQKH